MKILIDSGNCVTQNKSGGIQTKIFQFINNSDERFELKLFDKWQDKLDDCDAVHVFMASYESYSIAKLAKSKKIPVIVSAVIPSIEKEKIIVSRIVNRIIPMRDTYWLKEQLLKSADAIIAETVYEKNFICKYHRIKEEKVFVIPNGVDLPKNNIRKELFAEQTGIIGKFILQVGRFDKNKNQLNVIRSVKNTGYQLVFIGGPDKSDPEYYEQCKKEAGNNVHFLGWVDHNSPLLQSAYMSAHVVILPSHKEIFGNALFEGGINGANLVSTKVLPLKEWGFEQFVEVIDPDNVDDISKKIISAFEKEKSIELIEIIKKNFLWPVIIDKHYEIYRKLISNEKY